jgi:uncharacterized protein (TIGR02452 family)
MNPAQKQGEEDIEYKEWFDKLYGVPEFIQLTQTPTKDWANPNIQQEYGDIGIFNTPSLEELRNLPIQDKGPCTLRRTLAKIDIMSIIASQPGATFQVASQFNCLEMTNYNVTPAMGVTRYRSDTTQGPFCSIACGAGTVHRNYTHNKASATEDGQIKNADGLQKALDNLFTVQNGYTMNFNNINPILLSKLEAIEKNPKEREKLLGKLKVGFHEDVGVTYRRLPNGKLRYVPRGIKVSQVFCSAMSFQGVVSDRLKEWELLAKIILDATYEATLLAAYKTFKKTGNKKVFLTLVGGGAFKNKDEWIHDAINRSVKIANDKQLGLDIIIVDFDGKWEDKFFLGCRQLTQTEHNELTIFPPALRPAHESVIDIDFMQVLTTDAILHYTQKGYKTVALSFANHQLIGGKFFETIYAQEESLIHASKNFDLFRKLQQYGENGKTVKFRGYPYNNVWGYRDWETFDSRIILSKVEFDGLVTNGKIVKYPNTYKSAIITAAAPDYGDKLYTYMELEHLYNDIRDRLCNMIANIYTLQESKKQDVIILGAWGCGNYSAKTKSDPFGLGYTRFIARIFADIIYELQPIYKKICFTIPAFSHEDIERYNIFYDTFYSHVNKGTAKLRKVHVNTIDNAKQLGNVLKSYGNSDINSELKRAKILI